MASASVNPHALKRAATFATLHVTLVEGRNLEAKHLGGTSDPYVKMSHRDIKYRSQTAPKTVNPEWNETFLLEGTLQARRAGLWPRVSTGGRRGYGAH